MKEGVFWGREVCLGEEQEQMTVWSSGGHFEGLVYKGRDLWGEWLKGCQS